MKTFEEKWTAWVDDELSEAERAEFEASLDDRAGALAEKNQARKLGALLKEELRAPAMGNEEFFHHQLRGRIAAESAPADRSGMPARARELGGPFVAFSGRARPRSPSLRSARFSSCARNVRQINRAT